MQNNEPTPKEQETPKEPETSKEQESPKEPEATKEPQKEASKATIFNFAKMKEQRETRKNPLESDEEEEEIDDEDIDEEEEEIDDEDIDEEGKQAKKRMNARRAGKIAKVIVNRYDNISARGLAFYAKEKEHKRFKLDRDQNAELSLLTKEYLIENFEDGTVSTGALLLVAFIESLAFRATEAHLLRQKNLEIAAMKEERERMIEEALNAKKEVEKLRAESAAAKERERKSALEAKEAQTKAKLAEERQKAAEKIDQLNRKKIEMEKQTEIEKTNVNKNEATEKQNKGQTRKINENENKKIETVDFEEITEKRKFNINDLNIEQLDDLKLQIYNLHKENYTVTQITDLINKTYIDVSRSKIWKLLKEAQKQYDVK